MKFILFILVLPVIEDELLGQLGWGSGCKKLPFGDTIHLALLLGLGDFPQWIILDCLGNCKDVLLLQPGFVTVVVAVKDGGWQHISPQEFAGSSPRN